MPEENITQQFLERFLNSDLTRPVQSLGKNTLSHNKYDREDYARILQEMKELSVAEDRLTDFADTGGHMMEDTFFSLFKANPSARPDEEIRPSYLINKAVMNKAMDLAEYEELRGHAVNDVIATGLSCISMEPELEVIYDKLKTEAEKLKELEQQMMEMQGLASEEADIEQMMQDMEDGEDGDEEAVNYQEQQARIQEQMEQLAEQMRQNAQAVDQGMDEAEIGDAVQGMMQNAADAADNLDSSSRMWGLDPGAIRRLSADERIALAKKMDNPKFRKIAELFGPMQQVAWAEQHRKTLIARDEIYDIETGDNLSLVLPTELLFLEDPDLELDFLRKFVERGMLQYKLTGTERVAKGGIIFCEDGSGSMSGQREIWAKAVGLTLLNIAKNQNRPFYGIHFGGPGALAEFDFEDSKNVELEKVIEFAEIFFAGGTDFVTPLSRSLDLLTEQYAKEGAVKGDIVFVTDGQCGVPDAWLKEFKKEQDRLGFRVWGVVIDGSAQSEPLQTICDGNVFTIKNLLNGEGLREVFNKL